MKLVFKNGVDHKEYEFSVVDQETSGMYYCFSINLVSGMSEGEYSYTLYDDENFKVAEGLCQIGDYALNPEEHPVYNNNTEYVQYNG